MNDDENHVEEEGNQPKIDKNKDENVKLQR